jgi:Flp pilus assembly protein CpaB
MTYRTRNIFIAVALAVIAALLTSFYVSNYKRNVRNAESTVAVWVAKSDIPTGTSGMDVVKNGLIEKQDVARRTVVPGAISGPQDLGDQILTQPLYAGEQVTARRFGSPTELGVRSQLKGTMRAVEITGDGYQVLAGTLKTGDRVDLVADITGGDVGHYARVVLRDLLVLKAPDGDSTAGKISNAAGTDSPRVMLRVRDSQAPKLEYVMAQGRDVQWVLTMRAPNKAADSAESIETAFTILHDGVTKVELSRAQVNWSMER